ncbi:hypothetical protein AKJ09_07377 [Labilithrix luteola]|uniref:Uncharacterized protein n=1 Tax=Labilithrix luteola TaxID=1391654 RepID=A0A0K1Q4Q8_9BACT|nr:hypothetical protein AKJ09_07377 [Labilithrix luteola]
MTDVAVELGDRRVDATSAGAWPTKGATNGCAVCYFGRTRVRRFW